MPSIWKVQKRRENIEQHTLRLCDESIIEYKMSAHLVRIPNTLGSGRYYFALDIDGTEVSQDKKISHKYKAIIERCNPYNFITLNDLSDE